MNGIYQSPFRVYFALLAIAVCGIIAGFNLPISLFPNSSKAVIQVGMRYPGFTANEFVQNYGWNLEQNLQRITFGDYKVEKIHAEYDRDSVYYRIEFQWGTPAREALEQVQLQATAFANQFPSKEMRDSLWVWARSQGTGFLAISIYSTTRSLDDLYDYLEPQITPRLAKVDDADQRFFWNPENKEIRIELNPEKMAALHIFPTDVAEAVQKAVSEYGGGKLTSDQNSIQIRVMRPAKEFSDLAQTVITSRSGAHVYLHDFASVEYAPTTQETQIYKTSGRSSLILWVSPRPGGNVKKMSEDVIKLVQDLMPTLTSDVRYKIIVDPSGFIRSSIKNVLHEVFLAASLAVLVLFLFLGNVKNVITAAIEIPMSIVMAFILMKMTGINLNLISLGGLALSAGMNVDASVVVMENIFRHYHREKGHLLDAAGRLKLVVQAVNEVKLPIIASTIASLVVFIPIAFTRDLTNALLGDLARAVIYSHGLSALVALVLVPTVRLHILNRTSGALEEKSAPLERVLLALEAIYERALKLFLRTPVLKVATIGALAASLAALITFVLPRIQKEIIGRPDSDWLVVNVISSGHNLIRQNEELNSEVENRLMQKFGDEFMYTFCEIQLNNSEIMLRLKDKSRMNMVWKELEDELKPTVETQFTVDQWNPSELAIPNPPDLRVAITGSDSLATRDVAQKLNYELESAALYQNVSETPGIEYSQELRLTPHQEQWSLLRLNNVNLALSDLTDLTRVATDGIYAAGLNVRNRYAQVRLYFPRDRVKTADDIATLPVGVGDRIVPIKALVSTSIDEAPPGILREDGRQLSLLEARTKREDHSKADDYLARMKILVDKFKANTKLDGVSVAVEDAKIELTSALRQLGIAIAISIALIFCVMVFQLGDIVSALLVLVAIPLGAIGVLISIYAFHSTISLNSALGVILLNGIAVANSIILVDYMYKLVAAGHRPREAAILSATRRLRPILMTSLTTLLGMLPVALGFGEGGRILQPLGIAVAGGLFFSTLFTLFLVPALQLAYLEWREKFFARKAATTLASKSVGTRAPDGFGIDLDIL